MVKVNSADNGKVIGRQGQTADALRYLLRAVGAQHNCRASLKMDVPDRVPGGEGPQGWRRPRQGESRPRDSDEFGLGAV